MVGGAAEGTEQDPLERLQYLEFPVDDFFPVLDALQLFFFRLPH